MADIKVTVVGYGARANDPKYEAILFEVTKHTIWLKSEFGKQDFRRRDGKKLGDSTYGGYRIHDADLKKISGKKNKAIIMK